MVCRMPKPPLPAEIGGTCASAPSSASSRRSLSCASLALGLLAVARRRRRADSACDRFGEAQQYTEADSRRASSQAGSLCLLDELMEVVRDRWAPIVVDGDEVTTINVGGCVDVVSGSAKCGKAFQQWDECVASVCEGCTNADDASLCNRVAENTACRQATEVVYIACGPNTSSYVNACLKSGQPEIYGPIVKLCAGSGTAPDAGSGGTAAVLCPSSRTCGSSARAPSPIGTRSARAASTSSRAHRWCSRRTCRDRRTSAPGWCRSSCPSARAGAAGLRRRRRPACRDPSRWAGRRCRRYC